MKHSFETHSHTMFCEECLRVDLTIFSSVGLEHGHWRILAHAVPKDPWRAKDQQTMRHLGALADQTVELWHWLGTAIDAIA